jgi:flagellar hook-associated protein 3 FlgL
MTRISDKFKFDKAFKQINKTKERSERVMEESFTGSRIHHISEDPAKAVRLIKNENNLNYIDQYRKNITFAEGYLEKSNDALQSIMDNLIRLKELAVQQANNTYNAEDRMLVAKEVRQISQHIAKLGNTRDGDKYIFGGFRTSSPPVSPSGEFLGDDGLIFTQLDNQTFEPVNVSGREIFECDLEDEGTDSPFIQSIINFALALEENDLPKIYQVLDMIDKKSDKVLIALARIGARSEIVSDISFKLDKTAESLIVDNNELAGIDPIESAMELKQAEATLQHALNASARILQPTLLSFLN